MKSATSAAQDCEEGRTIDHVSDRRGAVEIWRAARHNCRSARCHADGGTWRIHAEEDQGSGERRGAGILFFVSQAASRRFGMPTSVMMRGRSIVTGVSYW